MVKGEGVVRLGEVSGSYLCEGFCHMDGTD